MNDEKQNKFMKFSNLLKTNNLYALCTTFFNISEILDDCVIVKSSYKVSKYLALNNEAMHDMILKNNSMINEVTGMNFFVKDKAHVCCIKKDATISAKNIFDAIYKRIQILRSQYDNDSFWKIVCACLFIPRGSVDIKANFYSVDILRINNNKPYLKQVFYLLNSITDINQLNFNFRELQGDFIGKNKSVNKRNTQIRINLRWFVENLLTILAKFNYYKFLLIKENQKLISSKKIRSCVDAQFCKRVQFYIDNILVDSKIDVDLLRKKINFDKTKSKNNRNTWLIQLAREKLPDNCSGCCKKYRIEDRTFKYRDSNMWYLEINHIISFANNNVDQFDNLCKLCPCCHRALTPNRASEKLQKEIIKSILENNPINQEFVKNFLPDDESTIDQQVDYVYSNLK